MKVKISDFAESDRGPARKIIFDVFKIFVSESSLSFKKNSVHRKNKVECTSLLLFHDSMHFEASPNIAQARQLGVSEDLILVLRVNRKPLSDTQVPRISIVTGLLQQNKKIMLALQHTKHTDYSVNSVCKWTVNHQ